MIGLIRFWLRAGWGKMSPRARVAVALFVVLSLLAVGGYAAHKITAGIKDRAYEAREAERVAERAEQDKEIKRLQDKEAAALADIASLQAQIKLRDVLLAQADAETRQAQEVIRKENDDYKKDQSNISNPASNAERVADICDRLRRNGVPNWTRICARLKDSYGVR